MDTIRVVMIGAGGNARGHMGRLLQSEGVSIVGICDPSEKAIEAARQISPKMAKVPAFADYQEMLDAVEADAAEISTPHTMHFDQIMACLDKELHVLCEKPMVCQVDHAHKIIERVESLGTVFGVAYQRHGMAPYRYCKDLISSGEVGNCYFIAALQCQNWYSGQVGGGTWRSKMALSGGGQLNDSGSHLLDIILWMTGLQPREVFSFQDNLGSEVDILSALSVSFDEGALGNMSVVGHAVNFYEEITLWTDKATLAIRDNVVWKWEDQEKQVISEDVLGDSTTPDQNFFAAIRGKEEIQATVHDALKVIQLTEAAWRSAATKLPAAVQR